MKAKCNDHFICKSEIVIVGMYKPSVFFMVTRLIAEVLLPLFLFVTLYNGLNIRS